MSHLVIKVINSAFHLAWSAHSYDVHENENKLISLLVNENFVFSLTQWTFEH